MWEESPGEDAGRHRSTPWTPGLSGADSSSPWALCLEFGLFRFWLLPHPCLATVDHRSCPCARQSQEWKGDPGECLARAHVDSYLADWLSPLPRLPLLGGLTHLPGKIPSVPACGHRDPPPALRCGGSASPALQGASRPPANTDGGPAMFCTSCQVWRKPRKCSRA